MKNINLNNTVFTQDLNTLPFVPGLIKNTEHLGKDGKITVDITDDKKLVYTLYAQDILEIVDRFGVPSEYQPAPPDAMDHMMHGK